MTTNDNSEDKQGGGERPRPLLERYPCGLCLVCALLVALGVFLVYAFMDISYRTPEFKATVTAYAGLDDLTTGGADAVAAVPTFLVVLCVNNKRNLLQFCAERMRVAVSYVGVPLARAAFPAFCMPRWSVATVPIVSTGQGMRGIPAGLHRLMDRRRERVPLSVQVTMDDFTTDYYVPMLIWCKAMLDGQPVRLSSFCSRFSIVDLKHALDGWVYPGIL